MEVGLSLHQLKDVGKRDAFRRYWPHLDMEKWPGREFEWAWCHPVMSLLLFVVAVIVLGGLVGAR